MKITTNLVAALVAGALVGFSPVWVQAAETTKTPAPETKKTNPRPDRLDINTASPDQLKAIRGLNEAQAKKIIEGRPYKRRGDLITKKVLPQETYDKIKDQISARSASATKTPAATKTP
jgi:competence protein ComEA